MARRVLLPPAARATGATRATAPAKAAEKLAIAGGTPLATRVLPRAIEPARTQVARRPGSIAPDPADLPCAPCPACHGLSFYRLPGGAWTCSTCKPPRLPRDPAPVAELPDPRTAPFGKCAGCGFTAPLGIAGKCGSCAWAVLTEPEEPPLVGWAFCHLPPDLVAHLLAAAERAMSGMTVTSDGVEPLLLHDGDDR